MLWWQIVLTVWVALGAVLLIAVLLCMTPTTWSSTKLDRLKQQAKNLQLPNKWLLITPAVLAVVVLGIYTTWSTDSVFDRIQPPQTPKSEHSNLDSDRRQFEERVQTAPQQQTEEPEREEKLRIVRKLEEGLGLDLSDVDPSDRRELLKQFDERADAALRRQREEREEREDRDSLKPLPDREADHVREIEAPSNGWSEPYVVPRQRHIRFNTNQEINLRVKGVDGVRRKERLIENHNTSEDKNLGQGFSRVESVYFQAVGDEPTVVEIREWNAR